MASWFVGFDVEGQGGCYAPHSKHRGPVPKEWSNRFVFKFLLDTGNDPVKNSHVARRNAASVDFIILVCSQRWDHTLSDESRGGKAETAVLIRPARGKIRSPELSEGELHKFWGVVPKTVGGEPCCCECLLSRSSHSAV